MGVFDFTKQVVHILVNNISDRGLKDHCLVLNTAHMVPEGRLYSSKSTNGGKGLKNSKINSYFTP